MALPVLLFRYLFILTNVRFLLTNNSIYIKYKVYVYITFKTCTEEDFQKWISERK